ncbi:MAG: dihydroneopterin aldolase [Flavobacteriales bacterium]
MGVVRVNGVRVYAYHGCMNEEARIGQEYQVDVCIESDFTSSLSTDELTDTVDYVDVHRIIRREMAIRSKLIEHVGGRIAQAVKSEIKLVDKVKVVVTKFNPPIGGQCDSVAIEVEL